MTKRMAASDLPSAAKQLFWHAKHMKLGQAIRDQRAALGLSQRALATRLGVSPGAVAQWESGYSRPTVRRLIDLSTVLGIHMGSFMGPGSPYRGQLVDDADELALLAAWRDLSADQRPYIFRMIRNEAQRAVADRRDVAFPTDGNTPGRQRRQS